MSATASLASALLALSPYFAGITEPVPNTADPARHFPRFAARADSVGAIAVVADLAEFEDAHGKPASVYIDDCRDFGEHLAGALASALTARGYDARALAVPGVGLDLDDVENCHVYRRWADRRFLDRGVPRGAAPFLVDSAIAGTPERLAAWQAVVHAVWDLKLPNPKKDVLAPLTAATPLRAVLGTDFAFVAVGRGTIRAADTPAPSPPGLGSPAALYRGAPPRWPGSQVHVALLDCRTGEVLWADRVRDRNVLWEDRANQGFTNKLLDGFARDLAAELPERRRAHPPEGR